MNIEQLKQHLANQVTVVDGWRLCKLCASEGYEYGRKFASVSPTAEFGEIVEAYAWLLSKCVVSDGGQRELDSDEGRELLKRLDATTMTKLAEAAIAWNVGDAKKN